MATSGPSSSGESRNRLRGPRQRLPLWGRSHGSKRLGTAWVLGRCKLLRAPLALAVYRADLRPGYVYERAFRQFEISDTWVFDRPPAGRRGFEGVIRDHLGWGRPDQIAPVFHRPVTRGTPGTFRTRVRTRVVDPTRLLLQVLAD